MGRADKKKQAYDKQCRELKNLVKFASVINRSLQLDEMLDTIAEQAMELYEDIVGVELYLLDNKSKILFAKAQRGLSPDYIETGTLQMGEGLAGTIVKTGKPIFLDSLRNDDRVNVELVRKEKLSSYAGIPLVGPSHIIGVLGLYTKIPCTFTKDQQHNLCELGRLVGTAVQNALIYEQTAVRARRFIAISRAITVTRQLGTLNQVLQDITKVLVQSLGFDQSWIGLVNEEEEVLQGRVGFGVGMKANGLPFRYKMDPSSRNPAVAAVYKQKPEVYQFVEDVQDGEIKDWLSMLRVQSFAYVPILSGDKALGVIGVFYISDQAFEDDDVKTLTSVSEQAAIAIENARLYEQVKTSEERYRILFESTGTSLAILNDEQTFRLVNHAFEALSGYTRDELIGKKKMSEFISAWMKTVEKNISGLEHVFQTEEERFTDINSTVKQVHITKAAIPGSSNTLVSLTDMTCQRELERRLYRSEELAAIGELSAGIAHEIRNPIVAITTSVSLMKDEPMLSEEGRQLLDVVKEESDHLAAIVEDFLRFARPKQPSFQEEDVNKLLQDVVKRYKDRDKSKIKWVQKYNKGLPVISLDRHQIQQVVTNLLLNGLEAMPDGGVIRINTGKEKGPVVDQVKVSISDTGIGIPEEEIPKIFQPFFSTKKNGTGMGLAICRRIMDEHHGEIFVKSKVEEGTTFSFVIPVDKKGKDG
jgi:PAS domain S-box-containing protein